MIYNMMGKHGWALISSGHLQPFLVCFTLSKFRYSLSFLHNAFSYCFMLHIPPPFLLLKESLYTIHSLKHLCKDWRRSSFWSPGSLRDHFVQIFPFPLWFALSPFNMLLFFFFFLISVISCISLDSLPRGLFHRLIVVWELFHLLLPFSLLRKACCGIMVGLPLQSTFPKVSSTMCT